MNSNLIELFEVLGLDADGNSASGGFGVEGAPVGVAQPFSIQGIEVGSRAMSLLGTNHVVREQPEEAAHLADSRAAGTEERHEEAARIPGTQR